MRVQAASNGRQHRRYPLVLTTVEKGDVQGNRAEIVAIAIPVPIVLSSWLPSAFRSRYIEQRLRWKNLHAESPAWIISSVVASHKQHRGNISEHRQQL